MKFTLPSLRSHVLLGLACGILALAPSPLLLADDHGGGGGHGGDDGGTTPVVGTEPGDDHGGHDEPGDDHGGNKTEFLGTITALPASGLVGNWTVDGRTVIVSATTVIRTEVHGAPVVGGKVEVEGPILADGSIQATSIKTEDTAREHEDNVFFGLVQALPATGTTGTWTVGGLTVIVSDATRLENEGATLAVGALARVEGVQQADGSVVASEIKIQPTAVADAQAAAAPVKLRGEIEHLPETPGHHGNWLIGGVLVTVSDDSFTVSGGRKAKEGRLVTIKGQRQINGTVLAHRVKVPRNK